VRKSSRVRIALTLTLSQRERGPIQRSFRTADGLSVATRASFAFPGHPTEVEPRKSGLDGGSCGRSVEVLTAFGNPAAAFVVSKFDNGN